MQPTMTTLQSTSTCPYVYAQITSPKAFAKALENAYGLWTNQKALAERGLKVREYALEHFGLENLQRDFAVAVSKKFRDGTSYNVTERI